MDDRTARLMSGNEALAYAAFEAGVHLGTGYPGTPSTEILERFSALGGPASWAPNEKIALDVALGAAFAGARALVTMKHVGLNVAADTLFTAAYTGVSGALVLVVADDPGMASSQNEQDSRHYASASGTPMLEPADSQEAYDYFQAAIELSERWKTPVLLRMTTRVSHSKSVVTPHAIEKSANPIAFVSDPLSRVMIPPYTDVAHRRLRRRIHEIEVWNETAPLNRVTPGSSEFGIISASVAALHAQEAAPHASLFKLGLTYPLPLKAIQAFADSVTRCMVVEEGDPVLVDACRAAGIAVEGLPEACRFGELDAARVRRMLVSPASVDEQAPPGPRGKAPELCTGCPHRAVFEAICSLDCIVSGDIGCYTLGVFPPFEAIETCVCMGASIGIGLGLRRVLPPEQAVKVVSIIGDSTFVHAGIPGLIEMVYNPPATGHVVLILDNGTTAMTGLQEHPGTGRALNGLPANQLVIEDLVRAIGVDRVTVADPLADKDAFAQLLQECLESGELCVIVARRPCQLAARRQRGNNGGGV